MYNTEFGANFEAILAVSSYKLLIKQLLHPGVYCQINQRKQATALGKLLPSCFFVCDLTTTLWRLPQSGLAASNFVGLF